MACANVKHKLNFDDNSKQDQFEGINDSHGEFRILAEDSDGESKSKVMKIFRPRQSVITGKRKTEKIDLETGKKPVNLENNSNSKTDLENCSDQQSTKKADVKFTCSFDLLGDESTYENKKEVEMTEKSLKDFEKQGAIPKRIKREDIKEKVALKEASIGENRSDSVFECNTQNNTNGAKDSYSKNSDECFDENQLNNKSLFSKPFFYVIPENPSPSFFIPRGTYYVVPKATVSPLSPVILHPEVQSKSEIWGAVQMQNLVNRKKKLETKIGFLNSEVANSKELLSKIYSLENSLQTKKKFIKEKTNDIEMFTIKDENILEDQYAHIFKLFPGVEKEYILMKIAECEGQEELVEKFVINEINRLSECSNVKLNLDFFKMLTELPHLDTKKLYHQWVKLYENRQELLLFISEEKQEEEVKVIQMALASEFPDLKQEFTREIALKYRTDPEGLKEFIVGEHSRRETKRILDKMKVLLAECSQKRKTKFVTRNEGIESELITETAKEPKIRKQESEKQAKTIDYDRDLFVEDSSDENEAPIKEEMDDINEIVNIVLEYKAKEDSANNQDQLNKKRLWDFYIKNFVVKDYLKKVPNPFSKFKGPFSADKQNLAMAFLRYRYPHVFVKDLEKDFNSKKNLRITCYTIDKTYEPKLMSSYEFIEEICEESLLQEIAYIENDKEIDDQIEYMLYLEDLMAAKEIEAEREPGFKRCEYLSCTVCDNNTILPSDAILCSNNHIFCKECTSSYIDYKVKEGFSRFPCPRDDCSGYYTLSSLQRLVPEFNLSKGAVKVSAEMDFCPICGENYMAYPDDENYVCQNRLCLAEICRKCRQRKHYPLQCEEVENQKKVEAKKKNEKTLKLEVVRSCPNCNNKFPKSEDCNKITCSCRTTICYLCTEQISGNDHFQGPNNRLSNCPLYN